MKSVELEKLLWSVALPGFGQFLNKKYGKGIIILTLEFLVNVQANLNEIIIYSFQGDIERATKEANFQWLMFYPCLYMFAIWDAYRDAGGGCTPYSFLPFVFSAFFGTVGVIYSTKMKISNFILGPVWSPMAFSLVGICTGILLWLAAKHFNRG